MASRFDPSTGRRREADGDYFPPSESIINTFVVIGDPEPGGRDAYWGHVKMMDQKGQEVLEAALRFPEDDRARIVEVLLRTLSAEMDKREDDDLASELNRRLEEALNDPTSTMPWSKLKRLG